MGTPAPQVQQVRDCRMQSFPENRVVAHQVQYEYGGKLYSVQKPHAPGATIQLQLAPVGAMQPADAEPAIYQTPTPPDVRRPGGEESSDD